MIIRYVTQFAIFAAAMIIVGLCVFYYVVPRSELFRVARNYVYLHRLLGDGYEVRSVTPTVTGFTFYQDESSGTAQLPLVVRGDGASARLMISELRVGGQWRVVSVEVLKMHHGKTSASKQ